MRSKAKKIFCLILGLIMVFNMALFVACSQNETNEGQGNGENEQSQELRRKIDSEHPINFITWYGAADPSVVPGDYFEELKDEKYNHDSLTTLYNSIPEALRPYSAVIIITSSSSASDVFIQEQELYEECAKECESLGFYFLFSAVNGQTRPDWRVPLEYFEQFAKNYKYFLGLNAAELYNGASWRGEELADHISYICDIIELMHEYGCYLVWHDANINGTDGLFLDAIQENEFFYDTLKKYGENVVMMLKQSWSDPSTEAVILGLWMSGLIGNWGIASDWWYRDIVQDGRGNYRMPLLYEGENGTEDTSEIIDSWKAIYNYPEAQYGQDMLKDMANGATCFKQEAEYFAIGAYGARLASAEYVIYPLLQDVVDKKILIPTKEEMFNKVKVAYLGREPYSEFMFGNRKTSAKESGGVFPTQGKFGLIPLLPKNLRDAEKKVFTDHGIELIVEKQDFSYFDALYDDFYLENTTAYVNYVGNRCFFMNNRENVKNTQDAFISPEINDSHRIEMNLHEHTYGYFVENEHSLKFMVNNYLSSRVQFNKEVDINTLSGGAKMYSLLWFGVREQEDGTNSVKAGNSLELMGRTTTIVLTGQVKKPQVVFYDYDGDDSYRTPKYLYTESFDEQSGKYVLELTHNGKVEFEIQTYGDEDGKVKETYNSTEQELKDLLKNCANLNASKYTEGTYSVLKEAMTEAEDALTEKADNRISEALKYLETAKANLVRNNLGRPTELIETNFDVIALEVGKSSIFKVTGFNEYAMDRYIRLTIKDGQNNVRIERINNFEYILHGLQEGSCVLVLSTDGTWSDYTKEIQVTVTRYGVMEISKWCTVTSKGDTAAAENILNGDFSGDLSAVLNVSGQLGENCLKIDCGEEKQIESVNIYPSNLYGEIKGLVVLASKSEDMSGAKIIYNGDRDNLLGFGQGMDSEYYAGESIIVSGEYRYLEIYAVGSKLLLNGTALKTSRVEISEIEINAVCDEIDYKALWEEAESKIEEFKKIVESKNIYTVYSFDEFNRVYSRLNVLLSGDTQVTAKELSKLLKELDLRVGQLINIKSLREIEQMIEEKGENYFAKYAYEDFKNEFTLYLGAAELTCLYFDENGEPVCKNTYTDDEEGFRYNPALEFGYSLKYSQMKQEEISKVILWAEEAADKLCVESVIEKIDNIRSKDTAANREIVQDALNCYNDLTQEQKERITNYDKLKKATEKFLNAGCGGFIFGIF